MGELGEEPSREALLDRYNSHTRHCPACMRVCTRATLPHACNCPAELAARCRLWIHALCTCLQCCSLPVALQPRRNWCCGMRFCLVPAICSKL